mmetsp:Transcript_41731/g.76264  ORF Transcript_41731/g.76264 Transcript_41731/m.76264 type:complete len:434 (-) Transcript_41731:86-1387(-)|eukprot:CAMPEP_0202021190 /NCGR_PEP_ID=MMETSP0905-20130828/46339_1 /ASSEMBLY_ACC=CAM_ASM_000554 /TAXON_ID=420261 /ORGANISM="Thalassiosira antarctica, Strain CCMP982" /LENGTH=433 /DNA_ID=CAMNT_0048582993 /DNA_START=47 /DNA_END=1348 /DNA_ORIENTATION=-
MVCNTILTSLAILQVTLPTDAFSAPTTNAGGDTIQKRTGKQSFLQKQSNDKLQHIATPDELHKLGTSLSKRKPGSHGFYKGWIHWRTLALDSIRYNLSQNLPYPADKSQFESLFFHLGVAADVGQMPSFEDAGARSGYAVEFFCRAKNLADLYIDAWNPNYEFPDYWLEGLMETPMLGGGNGKAVEGNDGQPYSMVSLGGGPGFDYVSAALATSFCSYTSTSNEDEESSSHPPLPDNAAPSIKATILDYEEGWGDLVQAMTNSTQHTLQNSNLACDWGGKCDITQSIYHPSNTACLSLVNSTQLWTCQYCVAENANLLQESKYIFFHDLFKLSQEGSIFVLSEVHPRLWPEFYKLIQEECPYMQVGFNKNGRQMLLRKSRGVDDGAEDEGSSRPLMISDKDRRLVKKFEELNKYHERKINNGWQRQAPKRRGA